VAGKPILLQVKGEEPLNAPPALYGNFLKVARVGGDVQFEFIFVDLNSIAEMLQSANTPTTPTSDSPTGAPITGQTVAKIVMPGFSFLQLKEHLTKIFSEIEKEMTKVQEAQNGGTGERRATGL
jgi:hypothetical protein